MSFVRVRRKMPRKLTLSSHSKLPYYMRVGTCVAKCPDGSFLKGKSSESSHEPVSKLTRLRRSRNSRLHRLYRQLSLLSEMHREIDIKVVSLFCRLRALLHQPFNHPSQSCLPSQREQCLRTQEEMHRGHLPQHVQCVQFVRFPDLSTDSVILRSQCLRQLYGCKRSNVHRYQDSELASCFLKFRRCTLTVLGYSQPHRPHPRQWSLRVDSLRERPVLLGQR